jgi:dynein heavy chain 1
MFFFPSRDGDKMAPTMEKKITELEMGLLHLQQNIEIPEVNLAIHPIVSQVVQKCLAENRRPKVDDFNEYLDNTEFLNSLQSHVNRWVREIQRVTKLDQDPMKGSTRQEISFWLNLERALTRIQEKRESFEVQLTFDILKTVKRFHATVGFDNDTGLKSAMETVKDHSVLMKDFPINDLLSANELDKIRTALTTVFQHLKKLRNTRYPVSRAGKLMEAVSQDLMQQMLKVLNTYRLMHIGYTDFERIVKACDDVFATWDDEYERLANLVRDVRRAVRANDVRMAWRVSLSHKKLQQRLDQMKRFRKQHEQLRSVIDRVLLQPVPTALQTSSTINDEQDKENNQTSTNGQPNETRPTITAANVLNDVNAIDEVNLAYESVKEVDALDVSKEGQDAWEFAMKRYDARIDRVEARITSLLRDQLGTAKNANEMFRIFSRFHELFVRPHIGGAIREYQTQLIQRVKDDIESLHEKFKQQYVHSKANRISRSNDLPPTSGSIIWAKQIEKQLNTYLRRVEHVLGKSWEQHVEGQRLKQDGDNFRSKLNTQPLFEEWTKNVQQKNHGLTGKIFATESTRTLHGVVTRLKVNFSPEIIMLSKEVRNIRM